MTYPGHEHSQPSETGSRIYTAAQSLHEKRLTARIRTMLAQYPGVQVGVHVQLRSDLAPQTVVVATQQSVAERDTGWELDAEPGKGVVRHQRLGQTSHVAQSIPEDSQAPGMRWVPDRVTASISLPRSYFQRRWRHDQQVNGQPRPAGKRSLTAGELQRVLKATTAEISPRIAKSSATLRYPGRSTCPGGRRNAPGPGAPDIAAGRARGLVFCELGAIGQLGGSRGVRILDLGSGSAVGRDSRCGVFRNG